MGTYVDHGVARSQEGKRKRKIGSLIRAVLLQLVRDEIPGETLKQAPGGLENYGLHCGAILRTSLLPAADDETNEPFCALGPKVASNGSIPNTGAQRIVTTVSRNRRSASSIAFATRTRPVAGTPERHEFRQRKAWSQQYSSREAARGVESRAVGHLPAERSGCRSALILGETRKPRPPSATRLPFHLGGGS